MLNCVFWFLSSFTGLESAAQEIGADLSPVVASLAFTGGEFFSGAASEGLSNAAASSAGTAGAEAFDVAFAEESRASSFLTGGSLSAAGPGFGGAVSDSGTTSDTLADEGLSGVFIGLAQAVSNGLADGIACYGGDCPSLGRKLLKK